MITLYELPVLQRNRVHHEKTIRESSDQQFILPAIFQGQYGEAVIRRALPRTDLYMIKQPLYRIKNSKPATYSSNKYTAIFTFGKGSDNGRIQPFFIKHIAFNKIEKIEIFIILVN